MAKEEKGEEGEDEVCTAVYKVNLHCAQCAREIKKPIIRTQGVHSVDIDNESGEITVKGKIDLHKIQYLIEKRSKKKVELVSPIPKIKEKVEKEENKEKKEDNEPIYSAMTMKVHLHCRNCEYDMERKLLKLKGVYSVNTDIKSQTVKVDGTIDPPTVIKFIHKNLHKHAEIISTKEEVKEQKKVKENESTKETKKQEKEKLKEVDIKFIEATGSKDKEEKNVEVKVQEEYVPYVIHCNYAPQLFSDENPNACTIM
ncbi:heavy metal-associated isoprenylated plant protein 4 isoform X2 [Macadamia integrifolia]|uniref:heavy metal-associated isoprenylated plant protein 4 isoform X2 n=1 Tax=Macadamia integrifolia TaxID=60698 RepID=UPI001C4EC36F|nr:heavy metal-associated isoprenylated plant protein 4 isoform X2 [Macadamia integrifolia]